MNTSAAATLKLKNEKAEVVVIADGTVINAPEIDDNDGDDEGDHDGNHDGNHDGDNNGEQNGDNGDDNGNDNGDNNDDNGNGDNNDNIQNDAVLSFIESQYPGAELKKREHDEKGTEVEIVYNGIKIKLQFDRNDSWVKSEWDFNCRPGYSNIPDVISAAAAELYPGYNFEYLVFIESAKNGNWYKAGLKSRETRKGMTVEFDRDGNVMNVYSN